MLEFFASKDSIIFSSVPKQQKKICYFFLNLFSRKTCLMSLIGLKLGKKKQKIPERIMKHAQVDNAETTVLIPQCVKKKQS